MCWYWRAVYVRVRQWRGLSETQLAHLTGISQPLMPPTLALPAPGGCGTLHIPATCIHVSMHDPAGLAPDLNRAVA